MQILMRNRTIILNGDPKWDFRSILACHGLDLFCVENGVFFRDGNALAEFEGYVSSPLGNFPEDFSQDQYALEAEIDEDLRTVFSDSTKSVSLAAVINVDDLYHFAKAGKNWTTDLHLSKEAKVALGALNAATRLVQGQVDRENTVSKATTQIWFALIVRDGGASHRDAGQAARALTNLADQGGFVHNAFLLSNGKGQDGKPEDHVAHFIKLRAVIDLLSAPPSTTLRKQIRKGQRSRFGGGIEIAHVKLGHDSPASPEFSALLRSALVAEISTLEQSRGRIQQGNGTDYVKRFAATVRKLLPTRLAEADAFEATAISLDSDVKMERERIRKRGELQSSELARADAEDVIARLSKSSFKTRFFMWHRKPDFYAKLRAEYESAFNISLQTYSNVVDQLIRSRREDASKDRPSLSVELADFVAPTSADGETELKNFRLEIKGLREATQNSIDKSREQIWRLKKCDDGGASERASAFQIAQQAEDELMGPSALWLILWIFLISLLPTVVFHAKAYFSGESPFSTLSEVFKALGLLRYVVGLSGGCALFVGAITAYRLMKKRRVAIEQLTTRLKANFDSLRGLAASRLILVLNRLRQSDLELVWQHINTGETSLNRDNTMDFNNLLMNANADFPPPHLEDVVRGSLLDTAHKAFGAGKSDGEKIRNFLARRDVPELGKLKVTLRSTSDQDFELDTIAHLSDVYIVFEGAAHG